MSYTGSKSFVPPVGTLFNINTGTIGTPVWLPVNEVLSITPSGRKFAVEKTTNLSSTAEEKLKTLLDSGTIEIEYNYLGCDDATDTALETAFTAPGVNQYTIVIPGLPSTKTETISFSGIMVEKSVDKIERDKVMKAKVKIDVTNAITFAAA